ncbi:hypothetical protein PR048_010643 [Dryococelus australis]|uniref:Transposase n=1 Tax=Dryococelus australis TaxID=614101 RepID=A0ABQ9I4G4_9NEOP|nr:hypothetical protein PR048_010643 [Dryococelus australis]
MSTTTQSSFQDHIFKVVIPAMYHKCVSRLKSELAEDPEEVKSVAFTCDSWTSKVNQNYLSLTIHYVTKQWEYKSHTLNGLLKIFDGIPNDDSVCIFYVTDNRKNFVSAAVGTPSWTHMQCLAHTLQLCIKDSKNETPGVDKMLSKARAIVGRYKQSGLAKERLDQRQRADQKNPLGVIQDVETRWFLILHA